MERPSRLARGGLSLFGRGGSASRARRAEGTGRRCGAPGLSPGDRSACVFRRRRDAPHGRFPGVVAAGIKSARLHDPASSVFRSGGAPAAPLSRHAGPGGQVPTRPGALDRISPDLPGVFCSPRAVPRSPVPPFVSRHCRSHRARVSYRGFPLGRTPPPHRALDPSALPRGGMHSSMRPPRKGPREKSWCAGGSRIDARASERRRGLKKPGSPLSRG